MGQLMLGGHSLFQNQLDGFCYHVFNMVHSDSSNNTKTVSAGACIIVSMPQIEHHWQECHRQQQQISYESVVLRELRTVAKLCESCLYMNCVVCSVLKLSVEEKREVELLK